MTEILRLVVAGTPQIAKPKFTCKPFPKVYNPSHVDKYKDKISSICMRAMNGKPPVACPLYVKIKAIYEPAEKWPTAKRQSALSGISKHTIKPDSDNIYKIITDAMTGIVWKDDSYIVSQFCTKAFGERAGVEITVYTLEGKAIQEGMTQKELYDTLNPTLL